ncbi:trypsin-like serine peptidase [Bacillus cereus]
MENAIHLIGMRLTRPTENPLSWSNEEHAKEFNSFFSKYQEQQRNNKDYKPHELLSVCGEDTRHENKEINIDSDVRTRATCSLAITFCDNSLGLGSGFFIGPRKVVTAAHALYKRDGGVWAKDIIVRPGLYRGNDGVLHDPFKGDWAADMRVPEQWQSDNQQEAENYDWGLISLETADLYNRAGQPTLELWAADKSDIDGKLYSAWGYPSMDSGILTPNIGQFYSDSEEFMLIGDYILHGKQDTSAGTSGGPLILNEDIKVPGIVVRGHVNCALPNEFTRVTLEVKETIEGFEPGF